MSQLAFFVIDIVAVSLLVFGLYFPRHRRSGPRRRLSGRQRRSPGRGRLAEHEQCRGRVGPGALRSTVHHPIAVDRTRSARGGVLLLRAGAGPARWPEHHSDCGVSPALMALDHRGHVRSVTIPAFPERLPAPGHRARLGDHRPRRAGRPPGAAARRPGALGQRRSGSTWSTTPPSSRSATPHRHEAGARVRQRGRRAARGTPAGRITRDWRSGLRSPLSALPGDRPGRTHRAGRSPDPGRPQVRAADGRGGRPC